MQRRVAHSSAPARGFSPGSPFRGGGVSAGLRCCRVRVLRAHARPFCAACRRGLGLRQTSLAGARRRPSLESADAHAVKLAQPTAHVPPRTRIARPVRAPARASDARKHADATASCCDARVHAARALVHSAPCPRALLRERPRAPPSVETDAAPRSRNRSRARRRLFAHHLPSARARVVHASCKRRGHLSLVCQRFSFEAF